MDEGVTFVDPGSCTLSEDCRFGRDVVIEPQTHLRGVCNGQQPQAWTRQLIQDADIGDGVTAALRDSAGVRRSPGGDRPVCHLRPAANIGDDCKIGNFVEVKKSTIAAGSKVNHLSYIGDAELGEHVNVGAGTITANYDGVNKHRTVIGARSKTGANSVLVAPAIGQEVTIAAGSTITKDVSDDPAIGRARQNVREGWNCAVRHPLLTTAAAEQPCRPTSF